MSWILNLGHTTIDSGAPFVILPYEWLEESLPCIVQCERDTYTMTFDPDAPLGQGVLMLNNHPGWVSLNTMWP